jgi:multisubunit Na+/H+ antiporter MnhC subunit
MESSNSKGSSVGTFIGVFIALLIAVGAYIVSPSVLVSITQKLGSSTLSPIAMRLIFTVICFVIGLTISMLVVSMVKPKDARTVNENKLEAERNKMREEQRIERQKDRR